MSTETIQPTPVKKKKKWPWVLLAIVVVIFIIAGLSGQGDDKDSSPAAPEPSPSTSASSDPIPSASEQAPTPEPSPEVVAPSASGQEYADAVYNAWLGNRGVTSSMDIPSQDPESVQGYLVSAESPVTGTVVFTAQLAEGDVTKDELEYAAMAVLQIVGVTDESLTRVEIVTADSLVRGVANRRDSLLLNQ